MAKLRSLIDGKTLEAAAPVKPNGNPNSYPSPAGKHVAQNIQDPYGATKDELDELNQAKLNYEMKKAQMQMKLAPVKSVVDGISQMHEMQDPNQSPDAQMGYTDPNDPMNTMGNPPNMSQTPGAMNTGSPNGQPIGAPGVAPGMPKEAIRPFKLGVPAPGQGNAGTAAGMPSGWNAPQGSQYGPQAPNPKGAQSLPGAKGPGDPKVQNKVKQAQNGSKQAGGKKTGGSTSNGKVSIHVNADSISHSPSKQTVRSFAGADSLRSARPKHEEDCDCCGSHMKAYGTSEGVRKAWQVRQQGSTSPQTKERFPKYVDPTKSWKPNPNQKKRPLGPPELSPEQQAIVRNRIANWSKKNFQAYGTSEGVRKAWDSRGHGKREAIVDINDKRGFNAPIDKENISTKKFQAAKLTMKKRKKLSKSQFVFPKRGPGHGSYPIPDANHGRIAKALVKMHGNPSEISRVNKAVKTKFGFTAEGATGGVMKAVSPPGWKGTVEHMKSHPEISNPFALAWWMKDKGDTSHKKPKK